MNYFAVLKITSQNYVFFDGTHFAVGVNSLADLRQAVRDTKAYFRELNYCNGLKIAKVLCTSDLVPWSECNGARAIVVNATRVRKEQGNG